MNRSALATFSTLIKIGATVILLVSTPIFGQVPTTETPATLESEALTKCNLKGLNAAWADGPDYQDRLEKYAVICREEGNKAILARILRALGDVYSRAGKTDEAIRVRQESLTHCEELGDVPRSIHLIRDLAREYRYRKNDNQRALEYFRKLLKFSEAPAPEHKELIAGALSEFADFESRDGDLKEAQIISDRVLSLRREIGHEPGIIGALNSKGDIYSRTGDRPQALEFYREALIRSENLGDKSQLARILSSIGHLYRQLGYHTYSLEYFERSLHITEQLGISNQLFLALTDVAYSHYLLRDASKSLGVFQRLLNLLDEIQSNPSSEVANTLRQRHGRILESFIKTTLRTMGELCFEFGMYDSSIDHFQRTLTVAQDEGDLQMTILVTRGLGEAKLAQGRYDEASEFFERSLAISSSGDGRHRNLGIFSMTRIADIRARQGRFAEGREMAARAELLSKELTEKDGYYPFVAIGAVYLILGDFERARTSLERAITLAEANTRRITDAEERLKFFEQIHDPYKLYIHVLMQLHLQRPAEGFDSIALKLNEHARARNLLEILQESKMSLASGDSTIRSRELDLQRRLNAAAERLDRSPNPTLTEKTAARSELEGLKAELRLTKDQIRKQDSRYTALTRAETLTSVRISRELLDVNTVLVEYSLGRDGSYVWLVTDSSLFAYVLPHQVDIERAARRVYELLRDEKRSRWEGQADPEYVQAAGRLSDMILGPVADKIKGKRLMIVADGALQYIPFSSLPMPKGKRVATGSWQPLALTNEIVSLPSASVLTVLRREASAGKQKGDGIAVIADPVFSETDERLPKNEGSPKNVNKADLNRMMVERAFRFTMEDGKAFSITRLPFTRREAESIYASAGTSESIKLLDFAADRERVLTTDLSKYRIIHFASHGILHSEHPDLSGIVLSLVNEKGDSVNGFLRVNEIYNMNLNADLVVLSACQTALGREVRGEGLIGLTRGFMYAGSPRVVASLWKVDDVATAELMKIFYHKMLKEKMRPAAALREAKIAMMKQKRWSSPYYWAAFELQGEWR